MPQIFKNRQNFQESTKFSRIDKIFKNRQNFQESTKFSRIDKIFKNRQNFQESTKFSRIDKISRIDKLMLTHYLHVLKLVSRFSNVFFSILEIGGNTCTLLFSQFLTFIGGINNSFEVQFSRIGKNSLRCVKLPLFSILEKWNISHFGPVMAIFQNFVHNFEPELFECITYRVQLTVGLERGVLLTWDVVGVRVGWPCLLLVVVELEGHLPVPVASVHGGELAPAQQLLQPHVVQRLDLVVVVVHPLKHNHSLLFITHYCTRIR